MGLKLSLSDINLAGLEETKMQIIQAGVPASNIMISQCDVSKKESISEVAEKARAAFGPVTILINNAGIVSGKTTLELSETMIRRTMDVNTISHLYSIKEFLPDMIANKKGHIVSIASLAGLWGIPGLGDYCASKFGAVAIDEALRLELKKNGHYKYVKTTCICPYFIDTGMFKGTQNMFPFYLL
jgi:all-trans-retinol dehydrogenase (NAD+)